MGIFKCLAYLPMFASIEAAVKAKGAKPVDASVPLSINGVHGTLTVAWVPDSAMQVSAPADLRAIGG